MNQRIFTMGLSTEAVSLYLVCVSLVDDGLTISTRNIMDRWTSTEELLEKSTEELLGRAVLNRFISDGKNSIFRINDADSWISG
jgi:hypothetical protein